MRELEGLSYREIGERMQLTRPGRREHPVPRPPPAPDRVRRAGDRPALPDRPRRHGTAGRGRRHCAATAGWSSATSVAARCAGPPPASWGSSPSGRVARRAGRRACCPCRSSRAPSAPRPRPWWPPWRWPAVASASASSAVRRPDGPGPPAPAGAAERGRARSHPAPRGRPAPRSRPAPPWPMRERRATPVARCRPDGSARAAVPRRAWRRGPRPRRRRRPPARCPDAPVGDRRPPRLRSGGPPARDRGGGRDRAPDVLPAGPRQPLAAGAAPSPLRAPPAAPPAAAPPATRAGVPVRPEPPGGADSLPRDDGRA